MKLSPSICILTLSLLLVLPLVGTETAIAPQLDSKTETGILSDYIQLGLENNLALQQERFSLEKSLQALREAKGMMLPSVSIEARYSRAGGGRTIDMPIGDLVNPIHKTLNQLLIAHGLSPLFPANIQNEVIPFLREKEQDTKLRLVQPLFQPAIIYNIKIKKDMTAVEKARVETFKRQLIEDISSAYYTYLKTVQITTILKTTRKLLEENLAFCQSLYKNNAVTEEIVLRSKAELSNLETKEAENDKNQKMAASYFNFLLNRPLDEEIRTIPISDSPPPLPIFKVIDISKETQNAIDHREEFIQLQGALNAISHSISLHKSSILPTISAVVDYGYQGETYHFTKDSDYWMGSLVLSWNIFRGGQDQARKNQAIYEQKQMQTKQMELEQQIRLQVRDAALAVEAAQKAVVATHDSLDSQEKAFYIISKKYRQDMILQIEFLKAQNDYTNAAVGYIMALYDYNIRVSQLERSSASFNFINLNSERKQEALQ